MPIVFAASLIAVQSRDAVAMLPSFRAELRIVAPDSGDSSEKRLPGTISQQDGKWTLTYGILSANATTSPPMTTVEVDPVNRKAVLSDPGRGLQQQIEFESLSQANFSEFAEKPSVVGGIILVRDRLKQKARYIREGIYQGRKIQVYAFREGKDIFGQIFYSPDYCIPLKVDTYNAATSQRTFITLEGISP